MVPGCRRSREEVAEEEAGEVGRKSWSYYDYDFTLSIIISSGKFGGKVGYIWRESEDRHPRLANHGFGRINTPTVAPTTPDNNSNVDGGNFTISDK